MPHSGELWLTTRDAVAIRDGANLDAFSRLRVSDPITLFESTFQYDLASLQYEAITSSGSITHDATDSNALLSISAATGLAALQSYRWVRYQPGKSMLCAITFVFGTAAANVTRRVGLFSATNSGATVTVTNGVLLEQTGASTVNLRLVNAGTQADQTVAQTAWNLDKLDGSGASRLTLDLTKAQILIIDLQWLGVGRVRVGFDLDGQIVYAHEFKNANSVTDVYMQSATLPVRYELTTSASATADMKPICAAVISEGGVDDAGGYFFGVGASGTAGNSVAAHIVSIRPFLTFNSIPVRYPIIPVSVETIVTGNTPVAFDLIYGATFSAGPTWTGSATQAQSGVEVTSAAGTINTAPIWAQRWFNAASASSKSSITRSIGDLYPLTLTANGANHANGTLTVLATGLGNTSAVQVAVNWKEIR